MFVHGCYWHRHEGCCRTTTLTRNRDFWLAKFSANVERDARAVRELSELGFRVLIVWECQTARESDVATTLAAFFAESGLTSRPQT